MSGIWYTIFLQTTIMTKKKKKKKEGKQQQKNKNKQTQKSLFSIQFQYTKYKSL